jgi:hypothetical protein
MVSRPELNDQALRRAISSKSSHVKVAVAVKMSKDDKLSNDGLGKILSVFQNTSQARSQVRFCYFSREDILPSDLAVSIHEFLPWSIDGSNLGLLVWQSLGVHDHVVEYILTPLQSPHTSRAFLTTRLLSTGVSTLGQRLFHAEAGSLTAKKQHRDPEEAGNRTVSARPTASSKGKGRREGMSVHHGAYPYESRALRCYSISFDVDPRGVRR